MISYFRRLLCTALVSASAALCVSCSGSGRHAASLPPQACAAVDSTVLAAIGDGIVPGAVVCVVKGDEIAYLKAYGNRQTVPDTLEMTADAVFDLASLSKCVGTTPAAMKLIEEGLISPDDRVDTYFPDFLPWSDSSDVVPITVRHLMTHSSGVDAYSNVPRCVELYGEDCPDSLMKHIATRTGRHFRPGSDFLYSCLNFVTLQNIIQKVTGERLCDYVQREVFEVLGLEHTSYLTRERTDSLAGAPIVPTEVQEDGLPLLGQVHDPLARRLNGGNSGNAGVFSNAEDLAVVCAVMMNGGSLPKRSPLNRTGHTLKLLEPATVSLMATVPDSNDPKVGRALGWDVCSSHSGICGTVLPSSGHRILCHTGYTGTSIVMDLDSRTAVILLANRVHPEDKGGLKPTRAALSDIVFAAEM